MFVLQQFNSENDIDDELLLCFVYEFCHKYLHMNKNKISKM